MIEVQIEIKAGALVKDGCCQSIRNEQLKLAGEEQEPVELEPWERPHQRRVDSFLAVGSSLFTRL